MSTNTTQKHIDLLYDTVRHLLRENAHIHKRLAALENTIRHLKQNTQIPRKNPIKSLTPAQIDALTYKPPGSPQ